jgi:hypothetical protein
VGRVRRNRTVGIVALGDILKKWWGAVGRDLSCAGYTWDDIGSERFPVAQFVSFVCHSPPGSALYHERSEGWLVTDHLLAQVIDGLNDLLWAKTKAGYEGRDRPERMPRPGMKQPEKSAPPQHRSMTVAEYAKKAGLNINLDAQ